MKNSGEAARVLSQSGSLPARAGALCPIEPSLDSYTSLGSVQEVSHILNQACLTTSNENELRTNMLELHMDCLQDGWRFGKYLPEPVLPHQKQDGL